MSRGLWMLICLCLIPAAGCCMCAAPYDYCGPDCIGQHCDNPDWCSRVGSVYSHWGHPPIEGESIDGQYYEEFSGDAPPPPTTGDDYYDPQESPGDALPRAQENLLPPEDHSAVHTPMHLRR